MSNSRERFLDLMKREILKLDLADLDFGIYRILNYRKAEIERFFDEELPTLLDEALTHEGEARKTELEDRLAELRGALEKAANDLGLGGAFLDGEVRVELAAMPKAQAYAETQIALESLTDGAVFAESEEDRLYNVLYTFFSRYYRDGDFQPQQRRARDARYSVPYNGEDVHFHWRSKGSHYIKTTEELKSYSFRSNEWRVRFELVEAFQEPDNVKGNNRYFIPVSGDCRTEVTSDGNLFVVPFAFRRLTDAEEKRYKKRSDDVEGDSIQERIIRDLGETIEPPEGVTKKDLGYHLLRYARKNRTDYFVHPQLGAFLRGELDYYLKNEFLDIDGLTSTEAMADRLAKLRVLRTVAGRIIDMLDEIESFQSRLFEKRRLVLSSSYLVPIRIVPRHMWPDILESDAQMAQWRDLFSLRGRIGHKTLETHPTLVVDTSLIGKEFEGRLLAEFEDIAETVEGVLINSENYGALRTIGPSFHSSVSLIYVDPPYNTGKDGFLYKDEFSRHSTWLSMMEDRVRLGYGLLTDSGGFVSSIGDQEVEKLIVLCDEIAGSDNHLATFVWNNEGNIDNQSRIKGNHEFLVLYTKVNDRFEAPHAIDPSIPPNSKLYNDTIANSITKNGPANPPSSVVLPGGFPASFQEGLVEPDLYEWPKLSGPIHVADYRLQTEVTATSGWSSRTLLDQFIANDCKPVTDRKGAATWFDVTPTGAIYGYKERPDTQSHVLTVIRNVGTTKQMSGVLEQMGLHFDYPKPSGLLEYVVRWHNDLSGWHLDYFAGSGTTARAVISTNRQLGAQRRFIAVEMAEYFDSILKPHVTMIMYSPEWKDCAPKKAPEFHGEFPDWVERSPRLVQVLKLESYEDTLNSLDVSREARLGMGLRIRYAIPDSVDTSEALLVTGRLEEPFDYQLEVHAEGGVEYKNVDLVATFSLVKGIAPKRYRELQDKSRRYVVVEGTDDGETVLVVWRSVKGLDPESERAFLESEIPEALGNKLADYAKIWHNADSALPNSESLDAEFKRLMFEPEPVLA